jgi:hypothetical protein
MVINRLILDDAHIMNEQEMKETRGRGTSFNNYCCTLYCLIQHNGSGWTADQWEGAAYGVNNICVPGDFDTSTCSYSEGSCQSIN